VEAILQEQQIKPILAVVPDNQDERLQISPPDKYFWRRVRTWQTRGWTIAMHGWQHRYVTTDGGIIGINKYSEFAGLRRAEQERKLQAGRRILADEGIPSDVWIAPAHSFDRVTLAILRELQFRYISDGFFPLPHVDELGMMWIPQQLWSFRRRPFGVWTICLHLNAWTDKEILAFRESITRYRESISDFRAIVGQFGHRRKTIIDSVAGRTYRSVAEASLPVKRLLRVWHGRSQRDSLRSRDMRDGVVR
jgi:peptidoglycan/xylan/chitin deacetylase (PgdA/CDA1 family)